MRLHSRPLPFIAAAFGAMLLASPAAHATGNVLLPSSSNDTSSAPNLGIAPPAASTASPSVTTAPAATSAPAYAPPQTSTPSYTSSAPASSTPPATATPFNINDYITPVDEQSAKSLPPGSIPTQVIHQPDNSAAIAQALANLPYTLNIAIGSRSVFGSSDVTTISSKLGLSRDQIASSCYLSVAGLIQTDKNTAIIDGGLSPKITVHYDGVIQNIMLAGEALCIAAKLPPGSGFINQIHDRYIVTLQSVSCAVPTRQSTQMTVTYDGTDKSSCSY